MAIEGWDAEAFPSPSLVDVEEGRMDYGYNGTWRAYAYLLGEAGRVAVRSLDSEPSTVGIVAIARYGRTTMVEIRDEGEEREIRFDVPRDEKNDTCHRFYWAGFYRLTHLYAPDGSDVLQLPPQPVRISMWFYPPFQWGFNHLDLNPTLIASAYNKTAVGRWAFRMEAINSSAPSRYADEPRVILTTPHTSEKSYTLSPEGRVSMQVGSEKEGYPFNAFIWIDRTTSDIEVQGAVPYRFTSHGSDWIAYTDTVNITSKKSSSMGIRAMLFRSLYRFIDYSTRPINATVADIGFSLDHLDMEAGIASVTYPASWKALGLYTPDGTPAENVYQYIEKTYKGRRSTYYFTTRVRYGIRASRFNPNQTFQILGSGAIGTWRLRCQVLESTAQATDTMYGLWPLVAAAPILIAAAIIVVSKRWRRAWWKREHAFD